MNDTSRGWSPYDGGKSIGQSGSENGVILFDDEHADGARITLERGGVSAPFAVTCGIYGWLVHTRFFGTEGDATEAVPSMKTEMEHILRLIPGEANFDFDRDEPAIVDAVHSFVERFP